MSIGRIILDKHRSVLVALILAGLTMIGFYYYIERSMLGSVIPVMPALSSSVPANIFVQPDYRRLPIDTAVYALPGHYTVIVFHQQRCPDCQRLDRELKEFLKLRTDVAVRKIDLGPSWSTEDTLREFNRKIWWTPFVEIYGPGAELLQADNGGKRKAWNLLNEWIVYELAKAPQ